MTPSAIPSQLNATRRLFIDCLQGNSSYPAERREFRPVPRISILNDRRVSI